MKNINSLFIASFIFTLLFNCNFAEAAARYWVASSSSNWNNTSNWSTSSGGSGGASVPVSSDYVIFNNSRNGNCIIDANVSVDGFTISGYTGSISNSNYSILVSSNGYFTLTSGTFNGGSGDITINSRLDISGGSFVAGTGTIDINGTGFYLTGGTFTSTSGNFYLSNRWSHTSAGTFNHNNGTVIFDGVLTTSSQGQIQILANSETFYNLVFALTSGTRYMNSNNDKLIVLNDLILSGGFIAPWNDGFNVSIETLGDVTITSTFGYTHKDVTLLFSGTKDVQNFDLTGATGLVDGHISINKSSGTLNLISNITMNGGAAQNFTMSSGTLNLNGKTVDNTSGGTLIVNGSTSSISGTGTFNHGYYSQTAGALTFNGIVSMNIYNNFTMTGGTFSGDSLTLDIDQSFSLTTGSFTAPRLNMYVGRAWTHTTSGTFNHNFGTVIFDGNYSGWYLFDFIGYETFYNVNYNKSSCAGYNKIQSDGDYMIVEGDLNLISGWIWSRSWETTGGTTKNMIKVRGNVTISPTYNCNSSYPPTLVFICGDNQDLDLTAATNIYDGDIIINKSSGSVRLLSNLGLDRTGGQHLIIGNGTLDFNGFTINIGTSSSITKYLNGNITYNGGSITGGSLTTNGSTYAADPNSCAALPVNLLFFQGKIFDEKVILTWATANEINNDFFEIQKSEDNLNFSSIGQVKGFGNSQHIINYSFDDNFYNNAISYYRIKQVDLDGRFEYSEIFMADNKQTKNINFNVYPNAAKNYVVIQNENDNRSILKYSIKDMQGKELYSDIFSNFVTVDVANLRNGIYIISIYNSNNELLYLTKLMVQ